MRELPLFPLNTVLFPGMRLPLHIFEERYKTMIGDCLEQRRPFGVVLIKSGPEAGGPAEPNLVGTSAVITHVERLDDGRMNLLAMGVRRFRIVDVTMRSGYLVGQVEDVEVPPDDPQELAAEAERVAGLFAEYFRLLLALDGQWQRSIPLPAEPDALADHVAAFMDVDLLVKQDLLETESALDRLRKEAELLGDEILDLYPRVEASLRQRWSGFGVMN
jgi:Lon protease-like protein